MMIMPVENVGEIENYIKKCGIPRGDFSEHDMQAVWDDVLDLNKGDIVVEVGVRYGKSLLAMVLMAEEGVKFYGVDSVQYEGQMEFWKRSKLDQHAEFFLDESVELAKRWDKGKISLIHIDGDHSYEAVSSDILFWYPHMKKGGVMFFHDCDESSPGVMQAVTEFVNTHQVASFRMMYKIVHNNTSIAGIWL